MPEKFKLLLSVMRLYESNFRNLHWNSKGMEFDNGHKQISEEYYELYSANIDKVAEIMGMFGINPDNYIDTVIYLTENKKYLMIDTSILYSRDDIVKAADIMLGDTCRLIAEVLKLEELEDTINAGIKSSLESILEEFTLQYRYINKRKLM